MTIAALPTSDEQKFLRLVFDTKKLVRLAGPDLVPHTPCHGLLFVHVLELGGHAAHQAPQRMAGQALLLLGLRASVACGAPASAPQPPSPATQKTARSLIVDKSTSGYYKRIAELALYGAQACATNATFQSVHLDIISSPPKHEEQIPSQCSVRLLNMATHLGMQITKQDAVLLFQPFHVRLELCSFDHSRSLGLKGTQGTF
eukprot:1149853-Pelagomonas_calceolata.AAC.1